MLIQARQARTANTYAPLQQRSTFAGGQIRWYYGPSLYLWASAIADQRPAGTLVGTVDDQASQLTITQGTVAKRPLKTVQTNSPAWQFDGVNDCLVTSSSTWSTQAVSVLTLRWLTDATNKNVFERTDDFNVSTTGAVVYGRAIEAGLGIRGNVGYTLGSTLYANNLWTAHLAIMDKSKPAASELTAYNNGNLLVTTLSTSNDNTNDYGTNINNLGARANGAAYPITGWVSSVLVFSRALFPSEAVQTALLLRQQAGLV